MRKIYIATSLDGYIAGPDNDLAWLEQVPNPEGHDFGFADHMASIDAVVMGRGTFDVVSGFRPWAYDKPVVVVSSTLNEVPDDLADAVEVISGSPAEVIEQCHERGFGNLYIDGGRLVTSFLNDGLIDEMTISWVPVLLGGGIRLFGPLQRITWWEHVSTKSFAGGMVQSTYRAAPTSAP
ncbi:MAG: dihydrofolate reductase family protein [Acidimicrobiia bacterium]|nr:dihydrofolate reductase family protein [Acidimicrobiia bacterium]